MCDKDDIKVEDCEDCPYDEEFINGVGECEVEQAGDCPKEVQFEKEK